MPTRIFLEPLGRTAVSAPLAIGNDDVSPSANAISFADWNRSSRSFSTQCRTM